MSRFGALRQFQFDHFYFGSYGIFHKQVGIERAVFIPASKISCTNLPDEVTTFEVIRTDAAFTGILCKASQAGAFIERLNSSLAQCPITHGANVEDAGIVRITALMIADG